MSLIPLTGTGGLFTRIGTLGQLTNDVNLSRGTTIPADVTAIVNQFESTDQNIINNIYQNLTQYQNAAGSFNSPIRTISQNTVIQMVNDVATLSNANSLSLALQYLINQMEATSQTVNQCTLSSSVTPVSGNIGNPNIVLSLHDVNNLLVEYCFSEPATSTCTQDAQSTPSLAGTERLSLQSQFSVSDTFSWLWPAGSGTNLALSAVSGMTNGGSGTSNWLQNGSFETWASNVPTSWTVETGTPGTTILQSSNPIYDGLYSLQFTGNGSEHTSIYQLMSTPSGSGATNALMYPNTIFAVNLWCRVSGTPGTGVIRVALSNGTSPINDNSGSPNSFNISLPSLSTTWVPFSGVFRTPNQLSSTVWLELKMTTLITSGYSVFFDRMSFCQMTQWYAGGPFISVFSGNVNLIRGDSFLLQINNNYGGKFQGLFQKLFNMSNLGLILPSSVSPTIPDSLI